VPAPDEVRTPRSRRLDRAEPPGRARGSLVESYRFVGILLEAAFDDRRETRRRRWSGDGERRRLVFDDRGERLRVGRPLERATARDHLVQDRPEGKLIGAKVRRRAARLLRRHVADRCPGSCPPPFAG
jgi:hypothetical protein